jgi:Tol biopolymer transport system component
MQQRLWAGCIALLLGLSAAGSGEAGSPAEAGRIAFVSEFRDLDLFVAAPGGERRLTSDLASESGPALSPDGRTLLYARTYGVGGGFRLIARELNGPEERLVASDSSDPAWSADGAWIAFVSAPPTGCRTASACIRLVVARPDGTERRVVIARQVISGPAWSPDGRSIAFTGVGGLEIVAVADGRTIGRIAVPGVRPSWSPDGKRLVVEHVTGSVKSAHFLEVIDVATGRVSAIHGLAAGAPLWLANGRIRCVVAGGDLLELDPDGSSRRRILTGHGITGDWTGTGDVVVFSRDMAGRPLLYDVDPDGSGLRRLSDRVASSPVYSPDGRAIAFVVNADRAEKRLAVVPADGGEVRSIAKLPAGLPDPPTWSPGGTRLAFAGLGGLFVIRHEGGKPVRLRGTRRGDRSPAWSPDGREIAFVRSLQGFAAVWSLRLGSSKPRLLARGAFGPSWSPNGRRIAYASDRTTFWTAIWTMRRDGGDDVRLTSGKTSALQPAWSPDGRRIAFVRADDDAFGAPRLWVMGADGRGKRRVPGPLPGLEGASSPSWGARISP